MPGMNRNYDSLACPLSGATAKSGIKFCTCVGAAYCIAMLAEYVQESWLAELRDIYAVPTSGRGMHFALQVELNCL